MQGFRDDHSKYKDILETDLADELWMFLEEKEIFIRMETATFLSRPALEAIQVQLVEKFGKESFDNPRYKQLAGSMVRQIMIDKGYKIGQKSVKVRAKIDGENTLFSTATRYVKA